MFIVFIEVLTNTLSYVLMLNMYTDLRLTHKRIASDILKFGSVSVNVSEIEEAVFGDIDIEKETESTLEMQDKKHFAVEYYCLVNGLINPKDLVSIRFYTTYNHNELDYLRYTKVSKSDLSKLKTDGGDFVFKCKQPLTLNHIPSLPDNDCLFETDEFFIISTFDKFSFDLVSDYCLMHGVDLLENINVSVRFET